MNPEVMMDLDTAVNEVATELFGLDLSYVPEYDTYRVITKALNRALRAMALEKEWSYYSTVTSLGPAVAGERVLRFRNTERPRIINDDAVRLVDTDGRPVVWAYFLPRDALHKYYNKVGLWCSVTGQDLTFSRPFSDVEDGLDVQLPVMREPLMFRLPATPEELDDPSTDVPSSVRLQPVDFPYPDVVCMRASLYYAQTDPVLQPRVPTLEAQYKDLMYQIIEREERNTEAPTMNTFTIPVQNGILSGQSQYLAPHSNVNRWGP